MCSLDSLLPPVPGICLQSAVENLKHSSWKNSRLFSCWMTLSRIWTMIVLLPESPWGAEREEGALETEPGVSHLLRGSSSARP